MKPKELIEAANSVSYASDVLDLSLENMQVMSSHILATVRPDDDEPVTREGWRLMGGSAGAFGIGIGTL